MSYINESVIATTFQIPHGHSMDELNTQSKSAINMFFPTLTSTPPEIAQLLKDKKSELNSADYELLLKNKVPSRFANEYVITKKQGIMDKSIEEITDTLESAILDILNNILELSIKDPEFYSKYSNTFSFLRQSIDKYIELTSTSEIFIFSQALIKHEINNLVNQIMYKLEKKEDRQEIRDYIDAVINYLKIFFATYNKGRAYRINSQEILPTLVPGKANIQIFQNAPLAFEEFSMIRTVLHNSIKESNLRDIKINVDVHIEEANGKKVIKIVDNISTAWPENAKIANKKGLELAEKNSENPYLDPKSGILICSYIARQKGSEYGAELIDNNPEGAKTFAITLPK